mgnify:CR=1 FL=1
MLKLPPEEPLLLPPPSGVWGLPPDELKSVIGYGDVQKNRAEARKLMEKALRTREAQLAEASGQDRLRDSCEAVEGRDAVEADITGATEILRSNVAQQYLLSLQAEANADLQDSLVVASQTELVLAQADRRHAAFQQASAGRVPKIVEADDWKPYSPQ